MHQAHLAGNAGQVLKEGTLSLSKTRMTSKPSMVAKAVLRDWKPSVGLMQALELAVIGIKAVVEVLDLTVLGVRVELARLLQSGDGQAIAGCLSVLITLGRSEALNSHRTSLKERLAALAFLVRGTWTSIVPPHVSMVR